MLTQEWYKQILESDEAQAFPWELKSAEESAKRGLSAPRTNLGAGRGRFWHLLRRLGTHVERGSSLIDIGSYPGTALRIVRSMDTQRKMRLGTAGFAWGEFKDALRDMDVAIHEAEFDIRYTGGGPEHHILTCSTGQRYDVAVCTEVIEHQLYPLSLLVGVNRFLVDGGQLYLTTNSVSFIGDILKLLAGRHNVERLENSHVLTDTEWRPHTRLYTLAEVEQLLRLTGFQVQEAFYFDNGNVYRGVKGQLTKAVRSVAGVVPHLRSHLFITAVKRGAPDRQALERIEGIVRQYNLQDLLLSKSGAVAVEPVRL